MPVTTTLRRWVVGAVLAATALSAASGCSAGPDRPQQLDDWQSIPLPDGMAASTLLPRSESLLVGGFRTVGGGRAPALARLPLDGTDAGPAAVPLTPATPYGKVADLVSLTGDEDSLTALGAAHGGAHANFRWTIWSGTAGGVTDRPQTFETFGGWEAGTLLGLASDSRGALIVGTWQGEHGADGAIWRAAGDRWERQRPGPTWSSTTTLQVGPRTVEQGEDGGVLVSGSVIDLRDGVRQGAAYWRDLDGSWTLTRLTDPGDRSEAWSTSCGGVCWSVGPRDGRLAVWSGGDLLDVPGLPLGDQDAARVLRAGDQPVIALSSAGSGRVLIRRQGSWHTYTAPDGRLLAAALVGSRLFLVTAADGGDRLWARDLGDLLRG